MNIVSRELDSVSPEIGRRFVLHRISCPIDGDRAGVILESVSQSFRSGGCQIHIENEGRKWSKLEYLRQIRRDLGSGAIGANYKIENNSFFLYINDFEQSRLYAIVSDIVASQRLFLIIFGNTELINIEVDWNIIYHEEYPKIVSSYAVGESLLFRSNLRSQDIFELSVIASVSG